MFAFSVWISAIGSSSATASPSCLSHRTMVPSSIESPIFGMGISGMLLLQRNGYVRARQRHPFPPDCPADGILHAGLIRHGEPLQVARVGHRDAGAGHDFH